MTRMTKNLEQKWVAVWIRKAVPPPEDEILLEPLRGVLISE